VVFQAPNGTLWLIHTTQGAGQGQANANVLVTKSSDGGKTWTTPVVLFGQPGAFVRQPLVVMPNGGAETNYSAVRISSDQGSHWKECVIPDSNGYVQPSVVRLEDGRYLAFFRSRYADFIYRSTSEDGCTWTAPGKTRLPNNNSSIQVTKLRNGHLAIAVNNGHAVVTRCKPQTGPRKPLSAALSQDGGETWPRVRDIETGIATGRALPGNPIQPSQPGREEYSYP
jgi:predicted neuraminidase